MKVTTMTPASASESSLDPFAAFEEFQTQLAPVSVPVRRRHREGQGVDLIPARACAVPSVPADEGGIYR